MKKQNGITLIALVITIIVLLILAGVSISMVIGDNGIASKATDAKEKTNAANQEDEEKIQESIQYIDKMDPNKGNSSEIKPEDYGKIVTNYVVDGYSGTWEIFYADDSNVYLITTSAVTDPIYNAKDMSGAINAENYKDGSSLLSNLEQYPAANKWFKGWGNSEFSSSSENMQATLFMLDSTGVWNETYKNGYADYAIGAPTYELLCKSFNDVNGTTYIAEPTSEIGYSYSIIPSGLTKDTVWNRKQHYWIAAPCNKSTTSMCRMSYSTQIVFYAEYNYNLYDGFRPIVCLNTSIILTPSEDNTTFTIGKK